MELTIEQALQRGVAAHKEGNLQEAEKFYRAILQSQPQHPDANHNLGILAVSFNKIDIALPLFKNAVEANPKIEQFWLSYIDAFIKDKQFNNAKETLDKARALGMQGSAFDLFEKQLGDDVKPDAFIINEDSSYKRRLDELLALFSQGNFDQALLIGNDLKKNFPDNIIILNTLGAIYSGLGEYEKAAVNFKTATELKPDFAEAHNNLGNALIRIGDYEKAITTCKRAIEFKPDLAEAYNNFGKALAHLAIYEEAIKCFSKAIQLKPDCAEAFFNTGDSLNNSSRYEEAVAAYKRTVELRPKWPGAYTNLITTLNNAEKYEETASYLEKVIELKIESAETFEKFGLAFFELANDEKAITCCKRAIALKPGSPIAHNIFGKALFRKGDLQAAIHHFKEAIKLQPNFILAHYNLGNAFHDLGEYEKAISYLLKVIKLKPDFQQAYNNLGTNFAALRKYISAIFWLNLSIKFKNNSFKELRNLSLFLPEIKVTSFSKTLAKNYFDLLTYRSIVRPSDLAFSAARLLKHHPVVKETIEHKNRNTLQNNAIQHCLRLAEIPLFIKLMEVCPIPDLEIEECLKELRRVLLLKRKEFSSIHDISLFQNALAQQCFINEFIYEETKEETVAVDTLEESIRIAYLNTQEPTNYELLCLSSYRILNNYSWVENIRPTPDLEAVYKIQVQEIRIEEAQKVKIPNINPIKNDVSISVQEQYEENPYPRWINTELHPKPRTISKVTNELQLQLVEEVVFLDDAPQILIAGCGTGQHALMTASRFKNSTVTAIDLSRKSLSYAKRKTNEFGLGNIEYAQLDIIDIEKLGKKFDLIECVGVLHHMHSPLAGWKALTRCLKPSGLMTIGLYSQFARTDVVAAKSIINEKNFGVLPEELKKFRQQLIQSNPVILKTLMMFSDFYSTSELRDLLFHVQEHRFTLLEIKEMIEKLALVFAGFELPKSTLESFKNI